MGNDCWYYRPRYAGMTKVCMRQSIVECGRIRRFGLCPIPPDSEAWRRCGFAVGQHEIPLMVEERYCPRDDTISAEMRLIVDGGCHPDCQHMSHCVRCGPICKAVYDKLMVER